MCGIVGCLALALEADPDQGWVQTATERISHRGPDDEGFYTDPDVALGFRRLAIIDLSPGGHQPMRSADGRYWMVYNGEIYNYLELGQELRQQGVALRTSSDSEVLLEMYARVGKDVVHRLRGMFAFAIWDTWTRELFCARDQFGIKPFYYTIDQVPAQAQDWAGGAAAGQQGWPGGATEQPGWPGDPAQQPGWPGGQAQQSAWPAGPAEQAAWPGGAVEQPRWPGGPAEQPAWPGGAAEQAAWPGGAAEQPAWPGGRPSSRGSGARGRSSSPRGTRRHLRVAGTRRRRVAGTRAARRPGPRRPGPRRLTRRRAAAAAGTQPGAASSPAGRRVQRRALPVTARRGAGSGLVRLVRSDSPGTPRARPGPPALACCSGSLQNASAWPVPVS